MARSAPPGQTLIRVLLDTYRRVETPEGVELGLRVAGPAARSLAWLLDAVLRGVLYGAAAVPAAALGGLGQGGFLILIFLGEWLYPVLFEVLWRGRTPGKAALGLVVLHDDGTPVGWPASLVRNLVRYADWLPFAYGVGLCSLLLSAHFQRLGDLAAGTVVCHGDARRRRERVPEADPLAPSASLDAAESRLIVAWAARAEQFTPARARELSDLLAPLTRTAGEEGQRRLVRIANWVLGRR